MEDLSNGYMMHIVLAMKIIDHQEQSSSSSSSMDVPSLSHVISSQICMHLMSDKKQQQSGSDNEDAATSTMIKTSRADVDLCCVCLSRLKQEEDMRVLPCSHQFHRLCVDRWFRGRCKTCPLCRFNVGVEEDKTCRMEPFTEEMVIWFSSFHIAGF